MEVEMNSMIDFIDPVNQLHFTGQFSVIINHCFTECTRKATAKKLHNYLSSSKFKFEQQEV